METVEEVFAQATDAEAIGEEHLVDDGWKLVEVDPEAAGFNGNGHHDEAPEEGQQLLFSWTEFMAEEPMKPWGCSCNPQPATLSPFEWALSVEHEWEGELVGAGR